MFRALLLSIALLASSALAQTGSTLQSTILPASARTATETVSSDITNTQWRGGHFVFAISTYPSGTFTPTIQGKDPVTGAYYTILEGSAVSSTSTTILRVYPGITASAGASASDVLPRTFRVRVVKSAATSATFSVGASLVP